jgi:hypothetical protein
VRCFEAITAYFSFFKGLAAYSAPVAIYDFKRCPTPIAQVSTFYRGIANNATGLGRKKQVQKSHLYIPHRFLLLNFIGTNKLKFTLFYKLLDVN